MVPAMDHIHIHLAFLSLDWGIPAFTVHTWVYAVFLTLSSLKWFVFVYPLYCFY